MIVKSAIFLKSATKPGHYPESDFPEVAFVGRSNVGKSSLINTLLNRKRLAKTSNTPGRTQLINFFEINYSFLFVDLPGYGYAKVPVSVKKQWKPMIESYFQTRQTLKAVVLLLDIRRTPTHDEHDLTLWLSQHRIPYFLVMTKADKLSRNQQIKQEKVISKALELPKEDLILFSAKTRQGKDLVWQHIEHHLKVNPSGE